MPSQMEHAMETMMFKFHKFAGDKGYLTKEDLRVLMEKEFPGFLEVSVEGFRKNQTLTIACNDYFVVHMKQKGKK
uniref:protein S100-A10 n=1 Tax=Urocitellus parryii TaxID=9999 RepID=UPI000E559ABA|nr:protein S100-A10 [Urocitellus parryii]